MNLPGYCECGRPTVMTPDVLRKLEEAYKNGFNDRTACIYAGISLTAMYDYQEKNPEFAQHKEDWKSFPLMTAQKTVANSLTDPKYAWNYVERKDPELVPVTKVQHAGKIQTEDVTEPKDPKVLEAIKHYEKMRDQQIREEADAMPNEEPKK